MARLKRPVFLFFTCQDHPFLDVEQLLRGVVEAASLRRVYGLSAAVGGAVPLSEDELQLVLSLPSDDWVDSDDARLEALADRGLVLRKGGDPVDTERRRRDEALAETGWNAYAALFHFLTRWQGVDLRAWAPGDEPVDELPPVRREDLERFVAERGAPPPAFHPREPVGPVTELPLVDGAARRGHVEADEPVGRRPASRRGVSARRGRRRAGAGPLSILDRAARPGAARSARVRGRCQEAGNELHVRPDLLRVGARARAHGGSLRAEPLEVQRSRQGVPRDPDGRRPSQPDALPRGGGAGPGRIRHRSGEHGGRRRAARARRLPRGLARDLRVRAAGGRVVAVRSDVRPLRP